MIGRYKIWNVLNAWMYEVSNRWGNNIIRLSLLPQSTQRDYIRPIIFVTIFCRINRTVYVFNVTLVSNFYFSDCNIISSHNINSEAKWPDKNICISSSHGFDLMQYVACSISWLYIFCIIVHFRLILKRIPYLFCGCANLNTFLVYNAVTICYSCSYALF